jgi:ethanolamine permease
MLEMGRAGYAPRALGRIGARTNTPVAALLANCGVGLVVLLVTQTDSLVLLSVFGALTLYISSSIAVIVLRRREPDMPRPYRTPLYPVTPVVALVLALVCAVAVVWTNPVIALVYAAILAVSWIAFVTLVPPERRTA